VCRDRRYREANRGKRLEYGDRYREANRGVIREAGRRHYEANREAVLEKHRGHYEANREAYRERKRRARVAARFRRDMEHDRKALQEMLREHCPDQARA
jgi:inorganic triphosphatase YgiF